MDARRPDSSGGIQAGPETEASMDDTFCVQRWVRDKCDWPMREKLCYLMLYSRRGKDGKDPYPGLQRLAKDMGATRNTATEAVRELQALGALVIETRHTENGQPDSHRYHLRPPWEATQSIAKKARGMHAPAAKTIPQTQGVDAQKLRVTPQELTSDAQNTGDHASENGGTPPQNLSMNYPTTTIPENKPKELTNKETLLSPSPDKQEKRTRTRSKSKSSTEDKPQEEKDLSAATQQIVAKVHELLQSAGRPGIESEGWGEARNACKMVLKGKAADPTIPTDEALAALEWGWTEDNWCRTQILTYPIRSLRTVWGKWLNRDNSPRGGRRYQDPAKGGAQFKPDSPWADQ